MYLQVNGVSVIIAEISHLSIQLLYSLFCNDRRRVFVSNIFFILYFIILLCYIVDAINDSEGVDCIHELSVYSSSDLFLVSDFSIGMRNETNGFFTV